MNWCEHWDESGPGYCHKLQGVRSYVTGWRCPNHTPAKIAGRPETVADFERSLDGLRKAKGLVWGFNANDTALYDQRARDSGKRASGAQRRASHG